MRRFAHLRSGGVSVVLDAGDEGLPRILHWGAELPTGEEEALAQAARPAVAHGVLDAPVPLRLLPAAADGWRGRPGLSGTAHFVLGSLDATATTARISAHADGLSLCSELALEDGVLRVRHTLRNDGEAPFALAGLATVLPVPAAAQEVLDLAGRWCRERIPQRRAFAPGTWLRESRHGRTGHDATLLLVAGTPGFAFRTGEVWGVHLAWSGNQATWAERGPEGQGTLGAAETLDPGEVELAPGEEYATPWLWAAWSAAGLDGLSAALHARVRASKPLSPGPWCSTPGRPSTSITTSRGSRRWPTAARRRASSASCSTTAGSADAATTPAASATGRSIPTCGPTACIRSSTT